MVGFLMLMVILAFICLVLGIINPKIVVFWTINKTRKQAVLVYLLTFIFFFMVQGYASNQVQTTTAIVPPIAEIKEKAKTINYKDLFRNIESYEGAYVTYTGEVAQVQEGNKTYLRVNVSKNDYGWEDTILLEYNEKIFTTRILEEDIIVFWGDVHGLYKYKAVLGNNITIPLIRGYGIELISNDKK